MAHGFNFRYESWRHDTSGLSQKLQSQLLRVGFADRGVRRAGHYLVSGGASAPEGYRLLPLLRFAQALDLRLPRSRPS